MSQENYKNKFKVGSFYSRNDAWKIFYPNKGERPKGGIWDTGYAREGINLLIFMNIGVPGSTGHDFSNKYDEEKEIITWFGKPNAHSGQPTFEKLLNGELVPLFFARWDNNPNFKYLGTGKIIKFKDQVDIPNDERKTIQLSIKCENLSQTIGDADKSYEEETSNFALEKHLEDFILQNWESTIIGKDYDVYVDEDGKTGQQYYTDTGPIDILAIKKDKTELLVIELKKGRASDTVIGQIQRYMGFIKDEVCQNNQTVKGLIIALDDDLRIKRALSVTQNINFYTYKINFELIDRT